MICSVDQKESIYEEFYPKVKAYIYSHVSNKTDVEDITSSVFEKIYSSIDKYDESKAGLSTWIYTITKNTVINYSRKRRFTIVAFEKVSDYLNKEDYYETDKMLERLDEELSKLPQLWQDILILHYYYGLSYEEISGKVKLSYANTRKQSSLAVAELKKRLQ